MLLVCFEGLGWRFIAEFQGFLCADHVRLHLRHPFIECLPMQLQVNKKSYGLKRRAYRDCIKRKGDKIGMMCVMSSKMEVVSEELGVLGVITPPLYRRTVWVK